MKKFLEKIFTKNTIGALLIGVVLFGVFKYVEYRLDNISDQIAELKTETTLSEDTLNKKVAVLEQIVQGSESSIASVLEQEKKKNEDLANQFSEVANTVGALSKLSKTDPELLKKYSKVYFLNEHYVPLSLSKIEDGYRSTKSSNYEIDASVYPFLKKMIDAGKEAGVDILVQSAYRSFGTQAILKSNYKITYGAGTANRFSADQGYSEHQLGTAMDLTTLKTSGSLEGFDKTPEYKWLTENAYKYGFIISYPKGNTYYKFEPWHWRFVGVKLATYLHEKGMNFYDADQRVIDNYLGNIFDLSA